MARNDRRSMRDKIRERAEDNKYSGGSGYLKLPEGIGFLKLTKSTRNDPTVLDIVPYEVQADCVVHDGKAKEMELFKGDRWWVRTILVHRNIGPDNKYVICPRTNKKPCPICEYRAKLKKDGGDEALIKDLAPQVKDIMNVWCGSKEGVKILEFSNANFRDALEKEIREGKDEWYDFPELEGGYTLNVVFSEDTFAGNKYLKATRFDFVERKDLPEDILDKVADLDEIISILPYDKLEALAFSDASDAHDEPQEREERSSRRREEEPPPERERSRKRDEEEDKAEERSERTSRRREEPEEKAEQKEEKSERSSRRTAPPKEEEPEGDGKCPVKGGIFGKDCNVHKDCMTCEIWEACADEADRLKSKK